jgi:hypothetical protein
MEIQKFADPSKYYTFYSDADEILDANILKERLANTNYICYSTDHTLEEFWHEI